MAVTALPDADVDVVMLTGDNQATARGITGQLWQTASTLLPSRSRRNTP